MDLVKVKHNSTIENITQILDNSGQTDIFNVDSNSLVIKMKNLKKFMICVLRLALCSTPEVMLDYPVDKLA